MLDKLIRRLLGIPAPTREKILERAVEISLGVIEETGGKTTNSTGPRP